jgi:hypothetical protein
VIAWLVVLTAPAAAEREFVFHGHSVHASECQSDVKVDFHVTVRNGRLSTVSRFIVSQLNFPNLTPPIPFGRPRGECFPGERATPFLNYGQGISAAIPFDGKHPQRVQGLRRTTPWFSANRDRSMDPARKRVHPPGAAQVPWDSARLPRLRPERRRPEVRRI